jgi:hypothetical protein
MELDLSSGKTDRARGTEFNNTIIVIPFAQNGLACNEFAPGVEIFVVQFVHGIAHRHRCTFRFGVVEERGIYKSERMNGSAQGCSIGGTVETDELVVYIMLYTVRATMIYIVSSFMEIYMDQNSINANRYLSFFYELIISSYATSDWNSRLVWSFISWSL